MSTNTDCVIFIDDDMARLVIAWNRFRWADRCDDGIDVPEINYSYSPKQLGAVMSTTTGQVKAMVAQAVAVGIFEMNGEVSELAQKCVNSIFAKKIQVLKN